MEKKIVITLKHSRHLDEKAPRLEVTLEGGSPWFGYVWIDDVCHTIYKTEQGVEIEKTKF